MSLNPLATFDVLCLGRRLQQQIGGFTYADIQLLAYLACLLSIYQSRPSSDWGYVFVGTELGTPFSPDLDAATRKLIDVGQLSESSGKLELTLQSEKLYNSLATQSLYLLRQDCLLAASASTLALPMGAVRDAMAEEPDLNRVKRINATRQLLDETGLSIIYEQFKLLRESIGRPDGDLRLPAVVWLSALYESSKATGGRND